MKARSGIPPQPHMRRRKAKPGQLDSFGLRQRTTRPRNYHCNGAWCFPVAGRWIPDYVALGAKHVFIFAMKYTSEHTTNYLNDP